jgi:hypothetical protein
MFTATLYGIASKDDVHYGWFKEDLALPTTPINARRPAQRFGLVKLLSEYHGRLSRLAERNGQLIGDARASINLANGPLLKTDGSKKRVTIAIVRHEGSERSGGPIGTYDLYDAVHLKHITSKASYNTGTWLYFERTGCTWMPPSAANISNPSRVWVGHFIRRTTETLRDQNGRAVQSVKDKYSFDSVVA